MVNTSITEANSHGNMGTAQSVINLLNFHIITDNSDNFLVGTLIFHEILIEFTIYTFSKYIMWHQRIRNEIEPRKP